jgi:acyl carrier protein
MIEEAVVVMKNMAENSYLCAYILPGPGNDRNNEAASITSGLRDYLSAYLPDYMVPSYFTEINEIPLTPNGKIDREALPEPGIFERKNEYIAPGNEMEEKVVRLCSEVLRVDKDKIGVHDNFFHLGANSLTIIQLNSRLKRAFKIDIPAVAMFRYLTVHAFAQFLSRESASTMAEILTEDMQRSGRLEEGKLRLKQKMKRRRGIQI